MDSTDRVKIPSYLNESTQAFKGKRISLYTPEFISKTGKPHTNEIIVHPGAVVILPFLDATTILLIKNYRAAVDQYLFELPAGTLEENEPPLKTAHRELVEETGYTAKIMENALDFYSTPGFTNELLHAYIAKDLTLIGQNLEDSEDIQVFPTLYSDALEMIRSGEIMDAKTILLLLFASTRLADE
jgi:ADP-ribose pyrophosphatase